MSTRHLCALRLSSFLALALMVAACGSGDPAHRNVFAIGYTFDAGGFARPGTVIDIGLPELHNTTTRQVRVTGVRLVGASATLKWVSVRAYNYPEVGNGLLLMSGDLPSRGPKWVPILCPRQSRLRVRTVPGSSSSPCA